VPSAAKGEGAAEGEGEAEGEREPEGEVAGWRAAAPEPDGDHRPAGGAAAVLVLPGEGVVLPSRSAARSVAGPVGSRPARSSDPGNHHVGPAQAHGNIVELP
jgi:hypothetical protein